MEKGRIIAHNRVCREEGEKGIGGLDCDQVAAFHGFRHSTGFPRFFSPKTQNHPQLLLLLFSRESTWYSSPFLHQDPTNLLPPNRDARKAPPP